MLDSSSSIPDNILQALLAEQDCVRRLARRLTRDTNLAQDIEQETWLAAMRNPPEHLGNVRAWLAGLVKFTALSMQRGERRRVARDDSWQREREREIEDTDPADLIARAELSRELMTAVMNLREPYLMPVVYTMHDLSSLEIARRLNKPDATVRSHIKRGLEMIHAELERAHAGEKRGPEHWLSALVFLAREPLHGARPIPSSRTGDLGRAALALLAATRTKLVVAALLLTAVGVFLWLRVETRDRTLIANHESNARTPVLDSTATPASALVSPRAAIAVPAGIPPSAESRASESSLRIDVEWESNRAPAAGVNVLVEQFRGSRSIDREGITGADGSIVFEHLTPERAFVFVDRGGNARVDLERGGAARARIVIPIGVSIHGRVVDRDSKPVEGAGVYLTYDPSRNVNQCVARSDSSGHFAIDSVDSPRFIGARKSGYAPSFECEIRRRSGDEVIELVLPGRGGTATGVVLGPDEKPVASARVTIGAAQALAGANGQGLRTPCARRVVTDAAGRFETNDLALGENPIGVDALGFALCSSSVIVAADQAASVEIRLGRGASVNGIVRDANGGRVVNAIVRAHCPDGETTCATSGDGAYAIDGIAPGEYVMIADGDALGGARQTIELVEGETALWDPTLGRGLVISGRVVDESDRALAGWSVRARSTRVAFPDNSESEANAWPPEWGRTKTDDAGRFILCNLFAGEWTIDVLGPGPDAHAEFVASSPPMENVVIRVHAADAPTSSVRGVVVDEAQLPLGGALVELIPESLALPTLQATTHATTGAFEFKAAASGSYRLRVSAPAFVEFETKQHEIAMGEVKDFEIISLQRSGSLVVRLARVGGAPVGSVGVWLTGLHDTSQLSVPLERDVARSNQLAPGSYTLFVQGEDGRAISTAREVEIRSGERTELEIELARD